MGSSAFREFLWEVQRWPIKPSPLPGQERGASQRFAKAWDAFVAVFNGHLSEGPVHYCSSWACCQEDAGPGWNLSVMRKKMKRELINFMFACLPTTPSRGKWTKQGPCLAFFVRCLCCVNCLPLLWPFAFQGLSVQVMWGVDLADPYTQEVNWSAVAGSRASRAGSLITQVSTPTVLLIFAIVLEPIQAYLTPWFLAASRATKRKMRSSWTHPPLLDLVSPEYSPVVRVLQYWSAMLQSGEAERLQLVYLRGHRSFEAWAADNADHLKMLRVGVSVAASWLHRRFQVKFPFLAAACADSRLSRQRREEVSAKFFSRPRRFLDAYWSVRLRTSLEGDGDQVITNGDDLALARGGLARFLLRWAWCVRLSIAMVEFVHGRNRARNANSTSWANFVSSYLLMESLLKNEALRRMRLQLAALADAADAPAAGDAGGQPSAQHPRRSRLAPAALGDQDRPTRKHSIHSLYWRDFCAARAELGDNRCITSPEFIVDFKRKLAALTPARIAAYQIAVDASPSAADARARPRRSAPAAASAPVAILGAPSVLAVGAGNGDGVGPVNSAADSEPCQLQVWASTSEQNGALAPLHAANAMAPMPVTAPDLEMFWTSRHMSVKAASAAFEQCHCGAGMKRQAFPSKPYPEEALSEEEFRYWPRGAAELGLFAQLQTRLRGLLNPATTAKAADVHKIVLLLACRVTSSVSDAERVDVIFGHMTCALAAVPGIPPRENYILCNAIEPCGLPESYENLVLQYAREDYVEMRPGQTDLRTPPFSPTGMMSHCTEKTFCARILHEATRNGGSAKKVHGKIRPHVVPYLGG